MLRRLVELGPRHGLLKHQIAENVSMDGTGGGFNNYLGAPRSNGLIVKEGVWFKASPTLFPSDEKAA